MLKYLITILLGTSTLFVTSYTMEEDYFISYSDIKSEQLIEAIQQRKFAEAKDLVTSANVNYEDQSGQTPLIALCDNDYKGNETEPLELLDLLIKNGAVLDQKNIDGYTPLQWAFHNNNTGICSQLLLEINKLKTNEDKNGQTPLIALCDKKYNAKETAARELLDLLIKKGAVLDQTNTDCSTPLQSAFHNNNTGICERLPLEINELETNGRNNYLNSLELIKYESLPIRNIYETSNKHGIKRKVTDIDENTPQTTNAKDSKRRKTSEESLSESFARSFETMQEAAKKSNSNAF